MKTTISSVLRTSLAIGILTAISACGLKGPLVLEELPIDQTQAPLENSIDSIPVETPEAENPEGDAQSATESE